MGEPKEGESKLGRKPTILTRRRILVLGGLAGGSLATAAACAAAGVSFTPEGGTVTSKVEPTKPPETPVPSTATAEATKVSAPTKPPESTEIPEMPLPLREVLKVMEAQKEGAGGSEIPLDNKQLAELGQVLEPQMKWWRRFYNILVEKNVISGAQIGLKLGPDNLFYPGEGGNGISWEIWFPTKESGKPMLIMREMTIGNTETKYYHPLNMSHDPKTGLPIYGQPDGQFEEIVVPKDQGVYLDRFAIKGKKLLVPATRGVEDKVKFFDHQWSEYSLTTVIQDAQTIEVDEKGKPVYTEVQRDILFTPVVDMDAQQFAGFEKMIVGFRDKMLTHLEVRTGVKAKRESQETVTFTEYVKYINDPKIRTVLGMKEFLDYWMDIPVVPSELATMNAQMKEKGDFITNNILYKLEDRMSIKKEYRWGERWWSSVLYWYDADKSQTSVEPVTFPDGTNVDFYDPYVVQGHLGGLFRVPGLSEPVSRGLTGGIMTDETGKPFWSGLWADGATYTKLMFSHAAKELRPDMDKQLIKQMDIPQPVYGPSYAYFGYINELGHQANIKRQLANSYDYRYDFKNIFSGLNGFRDVGISWHGPDTTAYRLKGANAGLAIDAGGDLFITISQ